MLAPLCDHLRPKDPLSSPLLCMVKDHYIAQLPDSSDPDGLEFGDFQWVMSEDVNIEHLLNIFTSIDASSEIIWDACAGFIARLCEHKPRLVTLGPNIEGLPDCHPSKPQCLFRLSRLLREVGHYGESKRLFTHLLKLRRNQRDFYKVASTLVYSSGVNSLMDLPGEAITQAKEALEISKQLGDSELQAQCLSQLALCLLRNKQVDTAEENASHAITLLPGNSKQIIVFRCHFTLGRVCKQKGNHQKTIEHFREALKIATCRNWPAQAFFMHTHLVAEFADEGRFGDANAHLDRAKLHAVNIGGTLAQVIGMQAYIFFRQRRFGKAKSEGLRAAKAFEKVGNTLLAKSYREFYNSAEMDQLVANESRLSEC